MGERGVKGNEYCERVEKERETEVDIIDKQTKQSVIQWLRKQTLTSIQQLMSILRVCQPKIYEIEVTMAEQNLKNSEDLNNDWKI